MGLELTSIVQAEEHIAKLAMLISRLYPAVQCVQAILNAVQTDGWEEHPAQETMFTRVIELTSATAPGVHRHHAHIRILPN